MNIKAAVLSATKAPFEVSEISFFILSINRKGQSLQLPLFVTLSPNCF
jgi:hypothetical protein